MKGGVAVFPRYELNAHSVAGLHDGLQNGSETSWVVGRSLIPLIAVICTVSLLTPVWLWLRRFTGIDKPYRTEFLQEDDHVERKSEASVLSKTVPSSVRVALPPVSSASVIQVALV